MWYFKIVFGRHRKHILISIKLRKSAATLHSKIYFFESRLSVMKSKNKNAHYEWHHAQIPNSTMGNLDALIGKVNICSDEVR